jgi:hypothetical protein
MMKAPYKLAAAALVVVALSGCAAPWFAYDGQKYSTAGEALSHQNRALDAHLNDIEPLKAPLTEKRLIIGLLNRSASENAVREFNKNTKVSNESINYLVDTDMRNRRFLADSIKKKNIYRSVESVDVGFNQALQPTADTDVAYVFMDPARRVNQWYLANQKTGKQVLVFDNALPTPKERVNSQLDTVKAFALQ